MSDLQVVQLIESIQDELAGYGYRRVTHELRRRGHLVNHKRIARLVKLHGLGIKPRRRFVRTTHSDHDSPIFPNLYRNVIPSRPDLVWVADFTYIRIESGFCYLAAILDACSRKVVGYAISRRIDTPLALAALRSAVRSRQPQPGCMQKSTGRAAMRSPGAPSLRLEVERQFWKQITTGITSEKASDQRNGQCGRHRLQRSLVRRN
ncbi:transposase InsO family protein [Variovorax boronicumulans]|uniref:Transposase InsO family protein n=1 Tax=Variovorax boronicumulans TaxID=436515 RepID=A0AAW8CX14_9BURK|nr:transposase InsO family protein [Variovorax boronicumulans]MDQ0038493.1 transposase InsO family protein [Variovorax boronicumulans]MDQ0044656.1 transposase InsO family protein [Variovorax boronicumulans]MDQ0054681.1 transposase InsO family protein [Variovorax boronicumulans]